MLEPSNPELREFTRAFQRLGSTVDQNAAVLNETIERVEKLEQLAQVVTTPGVGVAVGAQDRVAVARELIGSSTEKLQKYLTAIIFGGYAAYFGFWTFLHGKVHEIADALSGLLMLASMVAFFGYEIAKTIRYTWYLGGEYLKIPQDADAGTAADAFAEIYKRGRAINEREIRTTKHQTILSVIPASIAILVLGSGFGWHLISMLLPHLQSL